MTDTVPFGTTRPSLHLRPLLVRASSSNSCNMHRAEGLRLIRGLVEHATQWRREQYIEDRQSFPRISIPFPAGTKSFEGDWSVYHWARSIAPS